MLSFEEITRLATLFIQLGVEKIRLTGGEPLVRRDLEKLIATLSALSGLKDLSLTTNGSLLAEKAAAQPHYLPAAFRAYEQQRYLRTARVQIMARVYGEFYHARGPAAELRNQLLGPRTPEQSYEGIAWLYGGM